MKDQYETCLSAKSGECSVREKIAKLEAKNARLRDRVKFLAAKNNAFVHVTEGFAKLQKELNTINNNSCQLTNALSQWKAHTEALEQALKQLASYEIPEVRWSTFDLYSEF